MKNKTIFMFDLDGTLLSEKNYLPTIKTLDFLKSLYANNYVLAINTGRPYEVIKKLFPSNIFAMFSIISGYNGSYYKINNKIIKHQLSSAFVEKFIHLHNDLVITISIGNHLYTNDYEKSFSIIKRLVPVVNELSKIDFKNQKVYSIRIISANKYSTKLLYKKLNKIYGETHDITISTGIYILITKKNINKSNIVKFLANNNRLIYFGDSQNDYVVFKIENIFKIAPRNANLKIKNLASLTLDTSCNETIGFNLDLIKKWTH